MVAWSMDGQEVLGASGLMQKWDSEINIGLSGVFLGNQLPNKYYENLRDWALEIVENIAKEETCKDDKIRESKDINNWRRVNDFKSADSATREKQ